MTCDNEGQPIKFKILSGDLNHDGKVDKTDSVLSKAIKVIKHGNKP
jgi:hypothetical protein